MRKVLGAHLPETVRVGQGFVCYPRPSHYYYGDEEREKLSSRQLDILITDKSKPTLFKEDDLVFVTADAVTAIVEVKTKLTKGETDRSTTGLLNVLRGLADEIEHIRNNSTSYCWAGLFVYEEGTIDLQYLLKKLHQVADGNISRVINCVSLGSSSFVRFWYDGNIVNNPHASVWHAYNIDNLAPSYFVSNIVFLASKGIPEDAQDAWFPIEGTKEIHRHCYVTLENDEVHRFE